MRLAQATHVNDQHIVKATERPSISLLLDVPEDSFEVEPEYLIGKTTKTVVKTLEVRWQVKVLQSEADAATKDAIRRMIDDGLTVRDIGTVSGSSYQAFSSSNRRGPATSANSNRRGSANNVLFVPVLNVDRQPLCSRRRHRDCTRVSQEIAAVNMVS